MSNVTITFVDLGGGNVSVRTDADRPVVGRGVTPAEALAMEFLGTAFRRGAEVRYDAQSVPTIALALDLLDADGLGHAVPGEVRARASRALGREVGTPSSGKGMNIYRVHRTPTRPV
ncbi:hypothetical protein FHT32_001240 [Variovorax sp. SG517]|uniref:hypothetical protein n=1 Tax=Variovorax sp. SG517 TaxID=2587117 RepID=UPI00159D4AF8|nr:hypothetical protein [Variovorax sp. SG517]NVM87601.1 hypothetical protein [Variovorax sp. SG517]